ncbi:Nucleoporin NUP37 [Microdochium nivale]|nr:Nucleoporin NUP37 [Microdochium nivale]
MATTSQPRVRRTAHNTQYTYNLYRRINSVQAYPVLSPQGATIFLYAHEDGVTVVWRGGRRFKSEVLEAAAAAHGGGRGVSKQNGQPPQDAVMVLDSDDEDEDNGMAAGPPNGQRSDNFVDRPQFEDAVDEDAPYPEITQTLDLSFGTAVHHIAILPMKPCSAEDAAWGGAELLREKIVFAVSSASREVFLITLPLVPPSPLSKARKELQEDLLAGKAGNGKWGETITLLNGQERPSEGLAMTLVQTAALSERSKPTDRSQSTSRSGPRVVVAAHTKEALGTLRLWDVALGAASVERVDPFQTEYLPRPPMSISFNPTQHSQLLCNFSPDAVRIYDYAQASMPQDDLAEGVFPSQGSWLISFYPPFTRPTSARKPVIAAEWICRGGAIFVLLADGQWGIWDVNGCSPQGAALFRKAGPATGIRGDALTEFSVTGYVEGTSPLRNPGTSRTPAGGTSGFVPMTPHTRREALNTAYGPERLVAVKGGVTVISLPSTTTTTSDESIILWIGGSESVFAIPGVLKFWEAQSRQGSSAGVNLFGGAQPTRMLRLTELGAGLMGERCTGVSGLVRAVKTGGLSSTGNDGLPVEVLVRGESRLVVVQESESVVGTKIGGVVARRARAGGFKARDNSAIVVYPRPSQPSSVAYNLSAKPRDALSRGRAGGLFDKPDAPDAASAATSERQGTSLQHADGGVRYSNQQQQHHAAGFSFLGDLDAAADGQHGGGDDEYDDEDDDGEVPDESEMQRDVELEMLDIMEIDKELDALAVDNVRGRKRVFFES